MQAAAGLNGIPVNREAYLAGKKHPGGEGEEKFIYSGITLDDGDDDYDDMIFVEIYWPGEEAFGKLDELLLRVSGVGYCDSRVFDAVVGAGAAFLDGERSLDEVMGDIEGRVKLYLEE